MSRLHGQHKKGYRQEPLVTNEAEDTKIRTDTQVARPPKPLEPENEDANENGHQGACFERHEARGNAAFGDDITHYPADPIYATNVAPKPRAFCDCA
jgi:hypothetical protein